MSSSWQGCENLTLLFQQQRRLCQIYLATCFLILDVMSVTHFYRVPGCLRRFSRNNNFVTIELWCAFLSKSRHVWVWIAEITLRRLPVCSVFKKNKNKNTQQNSIYWLYCLTLEYAIKWHFNISIAKRISVKLVCSRSYLRPCKWL